MTVIDTDIASFVLSVFVEIRSYEEIIYDDEPPNAHVAGGLDKWQTS